MDAGTTRDALDEALERTPNWLAHEHWGSLASYGFDEGGFRADNLAGVGGAGTGLVDLILDPYHHGRLLASGCDTAAVAAEWCGDTYAMGRAEPRRLLEALEPHLARQRGTGAHLCLREGMLALHGFDLDEPLAGDCEALDARLSAVHADPAGWGREAMAIGNLEGILRPVALSWFGADAGDRRSAVAERRQVGGLLRIDDYAEAAGAANARVRWTMERLRIEPRGARGWRALLEATFDYADSAGCRGIKQMQAYRRDLDFAPTDDAAIDRDALDPRDFGNWVVRECARLAAEREWPFQIHIGTHNLAQSTPLPLERLARDFPRCRFVLLHCWPWLAESAWLAWALPNVYLDVCWLPILGPGHLAAALRCFLGYVANHKLTCSQDATSPELAVGASRVTRRVLGRVVRDLVADGLIEEPRAAELVQRMLRDNARELYRAS